MAKFSYQAYDHYGKLQKGTIEAQTFQQALESLKEQNLWIMKLFDQGKNLLTRDISFGGPKVKSEHFTVFCRQLATLYQAGIGLAESVRILGEQTPNKVFKKVIYGVATEMQQGAQLSVAATKYPTVFTTIFINMIRAGEESGNLDEMLNRLAIFYEKEHYTREKVKSAMIYPAIMGVVTVLVVTLMMLFVIPRFVANFEAMVLELPLPTVIVISMSKFFQGYWYVVLLSLFLPSLLIKLINKMPGGVYFLDYIRLRVPVFGKLAHKQAIARFSRTFSSLFAAAIPMLQTMSIVSSVVGNEVLKKLILKSREGLRDGQSIAEPLRKSWLSPPMVVQMLAIGERTGAMDTMLSKVADFYEADVDQMADRLNKLLYTKQFQKNVA